MNHGLDDETLQTIRGVLARFEALEQAILFGSRAKGSHRPGSDIDLALTGESVDWRLLGELEQALEDTDLPYRFSLVEYGDRTDEAIAVHIRRVGISLYERARVSASG